MLIGFSTQSMPTSWVPINLSFIEKVQNQLQRGRAKLQNAINEIHLIAILIVYEG